MMLLPEKILVIKLGALGDFIQSLGVMAAIRKHHPNGHITLLTTKPFIDFGTKCGYFDEVLIDNKPKIFDIFGWLKLKNILNKAKFSRVYDLQNNDRTSIYLKLFSSKNKPEWVGAAKGASHRNNSKQRTSGLAFDGHKQTLKLVGIDNIEIDNLSWIKEDLSEFNLKKPYILFVSGCAPQHPQKRWPAEKYGALANKLSDQNYQIVLLGTKAEKEITDVIKNICPRVLNLNDKTSLFQIASLASNAHAAVGNDTGPMHMIAPTGCPCLVLFSASSNPLRHAPLGQCVNTLQKDDLSALGVNEVYKNLISMI